MRYGTARITATASAAALVLGALLPAPRTLGVDPVTDARAAVSARTGIPTATLRLVNQRPVSVGAGQPDLWAAKFLDPGTGRVHVAYRTGTGTGGPEVLADAQASARASLTAIERKADAPLRAAIERAPNASLAVGVWLAVDTSEAEMTVRAAHPEVTWLGKRPMPTSIDQARSLRAELWEARRAAYASAAAELAAVIEPLGGRIGYASTSAPLVFVDLPATVVGVLADRAEVVALGLEGTWRTAMSSAGPTVDANWTGGSGDQGNGVRVAVVEYHNASNAGDLAGQVVQRWSTTGQIVTDIHPTWVAGAIGSKNSAWRGTAPGADIVSASTGGYAPSLATDRAIIEAADWAISPSGGDADIVNASIGQDTSTGAEEARRYFDSIAWESGRTVVAASGNHSTFGNWDVVSPGTSYNVMTVGGIDDRNTTAKGDDVLWYVPGSDGAGYRDPSGKSWNQHGDFNKPNLSAPAVSVRTANGTTGSGTSVASPIVAGIAAQLVARAPTLASWPEAVRAVLTAGAWRRTPMPGGGTSTDHEGAGTASALWSNRVLDNGPWGGWTIDSLDSASDVDTTDVAVIAGQAVHVALAWSSHTSGSNLDKVDTLTADLDLVVRQPSGAVIGSYTFDNPYEVLDVVADATGTLRISVSSSRFDAGSEPFAVAWAIQPPFADSIASPFYSDILWLAQQGITGGCGPNAFCPRNPVTREEMAAFLSRALDLPPATGDHFTDDGESTHQDDINRAAEAGIASGCGGGRFCPERNVTREEMASFLVNAFELPASEVDHFTDDETSIHEGPINALAASGITSGCTATTYCPKSNVTREQMAAFLHRALED